MRRLKHGDVITYSNGNGEAIVDKIRENGEIELIAWRGSGGTAWIWSVLSGFGTLASGSEVAPHPEPDRVTTEFVAWAMTQ